jgi:hypothetical protein
MNIIQHKYFILILMFISVLISCRPPGFEIGGGGSIHHPPASIKEGVSTKITLELSVWGEGGSRNISDRYKDVNFNYRIVGDEMYTTISMKPLLVEKKRIIYVCELPPLKSKYRIDTFVEYYFDEMFDGHYNKREEKPIKIIGTVTK